MGFFEYIKLRWFCSEELAEIILEHRAKKEEETGKLHYCKKHKQEPNQSNYAEDNCEFCKVERVNTRLRNDIERMLNPKSS